MNMNSSNRWLRKNLTRIAAALIVAILFIQAREPRISARERSMQASRFHFVCYTLPDSTAVPSKTVRAVNPSLKRISAWISSVGAAAAVGDLDGDGLANDVCLVDPSSPKAEAVEQVRFPAAAAEVARFKQA